MLRLPVRIAAALALAGGILATAPAYAADMTTLPDFFTPTNLESKLKIGVIKESLSDDVDSEVRTATENYIEKLKAEGHSVEEVTLPLLKPSILIVLLLRTMDLLRVFDQIFIMTEGGPGFATETISLYIYRTAFRFFDFGYAAAMSFVLLALTNIISATYIRLLQGRNA